MSILLMIVSWIVKILTNPITQKVIINLIDTYKDVPGEAFQLAMKACEEAEADPELKTGTQKFNYVLKAITDEYSLDANTAGGIIKNVLTTLKKEWGQVDQVKS